MDGVIQQRQKGVARQHAQRMVKPERRLGALFIRFAALDRVEQRRKAVELLLRGALDNKLYAQALIGAAHLQQGAHLVVAHDAAVVVQKRRERVERAALAVIADINALPRDDLHKAHFFKLDQTSRDHRTAHAHARTHLARRRQLVAGNKLPGNDHCLDLLHELIRERYRLDPIESHRIHL